ncbi:MAG: hypothetical protein BWY73_01228 [candidate division TA06 bacterium ADurb.Bin417]|uniref:Uncharacterized protein n=1 Tax=candidate division TA06 bacterium ADurb.Bin417 TaxID=1852828 RepID=A0A1V5MCL9_UNCT6|nr:MAG: hypothetical protein BWY73_01228 [candidate division TA06 bacterium ADurb.Bin417]
MKALKPRPAALPIMMLGGSPIRVAVPPMLEAMASAIRKGIGSSSSESAIRMVTGAMSSTVVTLSRKAEIRAVMAGKKSRISSGLPRAALAERMARYWKRPVFLATATTSIMPTSRKMVFQSIAAKASAWPSTPVARTTTAASSEMTAASILPMATTTKTVANKITLPQTVNIFLARPPRRRKICRESGRLV